MPLIHFPLILSSLCVHNLLRLFLIYDWFHSIILLNNTKFFYLISFQSYFIFIFNYFSHFNSFLFLFYLLIIIPRNILPLFFKLLNFLGKCICTLFYFLYFNSLKFTGHHGFESLSLHPKPNGVLTYPPSSFYITYFRV